MPKASDAKTALARKLTAILAALVLVGGAGLFWYLNADPNGAGDAGDASKNAPSEQPPATSPADVGGYVQRTIEIDRRPFTIDIADTSDKRTLGLGGRQSLAADRGMLFVYAGEDRRCFWMKDMNFPIDIIWLDSERKVTHIEPDVSPDTYPDNFCPDGPAQYVLELRSGMAAETGLKPGDSLSF